MKAQMVIDYNIPIPPRSGPRSDLGKTLKDLKLGDSFLCHDTPRGSIYSLARYHNLRVVVRREGKGFRVWRTT